jgi:hypothetical protein
MKRILVSLLAASSLALVAAPAFAAPGWNINARQATIENRINMGIRNGALTRPEAVRLRSEARRINVLERRYRAHGLSPWERRDLERRLDDLQARVHVQRHDRQTRYGRH